MNLHIEHDAAALARMSGSEKPACETILLKHGDARHVLAATLRTNTLDGHWLLDTDVPSSRIVTWSGTLAPSLFESDPRTWMQPGKHALAKFCDEVGPQLRTHQRTICFQPNARHVLNDAPSCLTFLRDRSGQPFEVALAPASMLEPSMLDRLEEHLQRQFEGLGERCAMVILNDVVVVSDGDDDARCETTVLGEGDLPRDVVRRLLRDCVPAGTPIVIDGRAGGESIQRQLQWLGD